MDVQTAGLAMHQRGASVPFQGQPLLGARVKGDRRHGLLMLLRNFADLRSTYILPWHDAPKSFPMNRFDRSLHSVVEETAAVTPEAVSAAVRRVNLSGAAGQGAADLEQQRLEIERVRGSQINATLVAQLLSGLEIEVRELAGAHAGDETFRTTKAKFKACGDRAGIDPTELLRRIEDLASFIHPAGVSSPSGNADTAGPLRKMADEVAACQDFFSGCAAIAGDAVPNYYSRAALMTKETVAKATGLLRIIDLRIANLPVVVKEWQVQSEQIRSSVEHLAWLLDGWDIVLGFAASNLASLLDNGAAMEKLVAIIPSDPAAEPRLRTIH